jgi:K+-sensing histidine kinase KdpD
MKSQLSGFIYAPNTCNIKEMMQEALQSIQQEVNDKQLQTVLEIPEGITVAADPEMLQFMHHHLLQQITAFANPGGRIIVKAAQEPRMIKVIIKTGHVIVTPGMLHLFERRQHNEGLALIICRDFMDKMGGSIWTATDSTGTFSFIYTLPLFH